MNFIDEAKAEAIKAYDKGEIPVGAVIVKDGVIIGRGHNLKETLNDVTAHAEILAIKEASNKIGDWRLDGAEMYVTLEPCPMCAGAIVQARIPNVVIGCMNPKAGCAGSVLDMLHEEGFNHQVETKINVCREECSGMLSQFFKDLRKKRLAEKEQAKQQTAEENSVEKTSSFTKGEKVKAQP